jgi:hypothetical protein
MQGSSVPTHPQSVRTAAVGNSVLLLVPPLASRALKVNFRMKLELGVSRAARAQVGSRLVGLRRRY